MSDDPLILQLILQIVLILINAFFAMTEIAVISINENRIRRMAEEGNSKAVTLLKIAEKPTNFLSTIQIGITFAGFLGSAFASQNFASRIVDGIIAANPSANAGTLNTIAVIIITLILSYFTLVFGELVPKRLAMRSPEKIGMRVAGLIGGLTKIMSPFVWLLSVSTNAILRLLHINPHEAAAAVTEEEIRLMVDIGEEKGSIATDEREMIENIFEFDNKNAEDVMTHRTDVYAIWVDEDPIEIRKIIQESGHSRFPVYDEDIDDIIGILYLRDYFVNICQESPRPLKDLLRTPYFVPETVHTDVLFKDLQQKKVHIAVVVDEYGGTSGIVTMEDLLEEIVGSIYDEYDPPEEEFEQLSDNLWRVEGSMPLDTLAELLSIELPIDEFDTLGGLVFGQLNSIPADGSYPEVEAYGLKILVDEIEDRRIVKTLVSKLEEAQEQLDTPQAEQS
ncbi:MAG: hemolysin family protein [Christensenellales bacterium]